MPMQTAWSFLTLSILFCLLGKTDLANKDLLNCRLSIFRDQSHYLISCTKNHCRFRNQHPAVTHNCDDARANADRALSMLRAAGIDDARLLDADANGQKVWRLRVGPLQPVAAPELAARLVGLGFGTPQRVRE